MTRCVELRFASHHATKHKVCFVEVDAKGYGVPKPVRSDKAVINYVYITKTAHAALGEPEMLHVTVEVKP
jgi:hypothetical protein